VIKEDSLLTSGGVTAVVLALKWMRLLCVVLRGEKTAITLNYNGVTGTVVALKQARLL